jgi:streptogramin lyase
MKTSNARAFAAAMLLAGCTGTPNQVPATANAQETSVNARAFTIKTFTPGKTPGFPTGAVAEDIVAGPDGTMWFTDYGALAIGRLDPRGKGSVTEFSKGLNANAAPISIVPASDGNFWFSDSGNGDIGRITPAGTITEYSNPRLATFSAVGIAASGHDVWAVELGPPPRSNLARVSMQGKVAVIALPKGLSADGAIAADLAGNLWLTAFNGRNLVLVERLSSGAFKTFPTGFVGGGEPCCPNEALKRLVVGPDGRPWFTTLYYSSPTGPTNAVVTLATSGIKVYRFRRYTYPVYPSGIATDGKSLWVSGGDVFQVNGAIYHVTTAGEHSAHPVDSVPIGIAAANGTLWFTNYFPTVGSSISEVTSD